MQRIIAMLFSLACLLDQAAYAPRPVSWLLVRLLLPVESLIRHFVLRTGWEAGAVGFFLPDPPDLRASDSRSAALDLADCFLSFAEALRSLPKQLYERWRTCEALQSALRQLMQRLFKGSGVLAGAASPCSPPLIDTS